MISMAKTILITMLIIIAIIFIYPIEVLLSVIGISIFMTDFNSDRKTINFRNVEIDNYERVAVLGTRGNKCKCKAIYFSDEEAKEVEIKIKNDEDWTDKPFKENILNQYERMNVKVKNLGKSYYYLIKYDRTNVVIETNRQVIDNEGAQWYDSAIYDSDNKVLYNYYEFYER